MPRTRSEKVAIGFMAAWLVFWAAGMLIVLYGLGGAVPRGELAAILFMVIWLAAAGFGFYAGARKLRRLLMRDRPVRRPPPDRAWHDGMSEGMSERPRK